VARSLPIISKANLRIEVGHSKEVAPASKVATMRPRWRPCEQGEGSHRLSLGLRKYRCLPAAMPVSPTNAS